MERKWRGVRTSEHDEPLCTGETYRGHVTMTLAKVQRSDDAVLEALAAPPWP